MSYTLCFKSNMLAIYNPSSLSLFLSLLPNFSIFRATVIPGVSMGTQMRDLLRCGSPSPVVASRQIQSACAPFVVHILLPLITRSSESTAIRRNPDNSNPRRLSVYVSRGLLLSTSTIQRELGLQLCFCKQLYVIIPLGRVTAAYMYVYRQWIKG